MAAICAGAVGFADLRGCSASRRSSLFPGSRARHRRLGDDAGYERTLPGRLRTRTEAGDPFWGFLPFAAMLATLLWAVARPPTRSKVKLEPARRSSDGTAARARDRGRREHDRDRDRDGRFLAAAVAGPPRGDRCELIAAGGMSVASGHGRPRRRARHRHAPARLAHAGAAGRARGRLRAARDDARHVRADLRWRPRRVRGRAAAGDGDTPLALALLARLPSSSAASRRTRRSAPPASSAWHGCHRLPPRGSGGTRASRAWSSTRASRCRSSPPPSSRARPASPSTGSCASSRGSPRTATAADSYDELEDALVARLEAAAARRARWPSSR